MKLMQKQKICFEPLLAFLSCTLCLASPAWATGYTWTGVAGNWSVPSNWSPGLVPSTGDTVYINSGTATINTAGYIAPYVYVSQTGPTGSLVISGGGTLSSVDVPIGTNTGSTGTMTVTGVGSLFSVSDLLSVGYQGTGTLTVSGGATVNIFGEMIGYYSGSNGTVTVTGAGSNMTVGIGGFILGANSGSTASLTVSNGGTVSYVDPSNITANVIGHLAGSNATVTITDPGSLYSTNYLYIGNSGTGVVTVTNYGALTAAGTITIAANAGSSGTMNIGSAAGSGATAPGAVSAAKIVFGSGSGTIVFNHTSNNYIFTPSISGYGTITNVAGVTHLVGDLTGFTGSIQLNGGTLDFTNPSQTSNSNTSTTITGALSGSGNMIFSAGKYYIVSNSSGFSGTTTVSNTGMLSVNGSLGGTMSVVSGGRLQGSGTVKNVTIGSGGTVAPGNSIGTLNVSGYLTMQQGSVYSVEVSATGASDKIAVSGTATISSGSTVSVVPYPLYGVKTYNILTTTGGITGTFSGVSLSQPNLFLTPYLSYDANNVYLKIAQTAPFFSAAGSVNQASVSNAIDAMKNTDMFNIVSNIGNVGLARSAYQSLDGEIHANIKASTMEDLNELSDILATHMDQSDNAANQKGSLRNGAKVISLQDYRRKQLNGNRSSQALGEGRSDVSLWAQVFDSWSHTQGDNTTFNTHKDGGIVGADWMTTLKWRTGAAFSFKESAYEQHDGSGAVGDSKNIGFSLYANRTWGSVTAKTGTAYTYNKISTKRPINIGTFSDMPTANYNVHDFLAFGETGYRFGTPQSRIEPFINAGLNLAEAPSFTEAGGIASLATNESLWWYGSVLSGVRGQQRVLIEGKQIDLSASVGFKHVMGDVTPNETMRFLNGGTFAVESAPIARNAIVPTLGMLYNLGEASALGMSYNGQIDADGISFRHSLRWFFNAAF